MNFACALDVTLDQDKANQCAMFILGTMAKPMPPAEEGVWRSWFLFGKAG